MKYSKYLCRILCLASFIIFGVALSDVYSQDKVLPLDKLKNYSGNGGIYYALPRTVIQVNVKIIRTENFKGLYSAFADKYLGVEEVIQYDNTKYDIEKIELCSYTEPDPDQIYFMEVKDEDSKKNQAITISLSESGIIQAVNEDLPEAILSDSGCKKEFEIYCASDNKPKSGSIFNQFIISNFIESFDTLIKVITIDDTTTIEEQVLQAKLVKKTKEQKAAELAQKLNTIRSDRNNLLIGYQEVAYSKESLEYLNEELKSLESDIIKLFLGASTQSDEYFSFRYIPQSSNTNGSNVIFKFSPTLGIIDKSANDSNAVTLVFSSNGMTERINESFVQNNSDDGFYYRIPEYSNIKLDYEGTTLAETTLLIEQYGSPVKLPPNKAKVIYHKDSGSIKRFEVE